MSPAGEDEGEGGQCTRAEESVRSSKLELEREREPAEAREGRVGVAVHRYASSRDPRRVSG